MGLAVVIRVMAFAPDRTTTAMGGRTVIKLLGRFTVTFPALISLTACVEPPDDTNFSQPVSTDPLIAPLAVPVPEPVEVSGIPSDPLLEQAAAAIDATEDSAQATGQQEELDPAQNLALLTCGAHKTIGFVGKPLSEVQPSLPENVRVIRPEDVVTQDYNTARMNVAINDSGGITKIDCG